MAPFLLYDIQSPTICFTDESFTWETQEDVPFAEQLTTPKERLKRNEVLTFDMINSFHKIIKRPPSALEPQDSFDDFSFALFVEALSASPFEIRRGADLIANVLLPRTFWRPGEVFLSFLSFKNADLTTFQVLSQVGLYLGSIDCI